MNTITKITKSVFVAIIFTVSVSNVFSSPVTSSDVETLTVFEAKPTAEDVELRWQLEEGSESQLFVQRAGMDMQFETIGNLKSAKTNQFTDDQPQKGFSFYRLATQHPDGTIIYHKTVTISR